jgi:hypothetical protein
MDVNARIKVLTRRITIKIFCSRIESKVQHCSQLETKSFIELDIHLISDSLTLTLENVTRNSTILRHILKDKNRLFIQLI